MVLKSLGQASSFGQDGIKAWIYPYTLKNKNRTKSKKQWFSEIEQPASERKITKEVNSIIDTTCALREFLGCS